jgi:hypothetical protein
MGIEGMTALCYTYVRVYQMSTKAFVTQPLLCWGCGSFRLGGHVQDVDQSSWCLVGLSFKNKSYRSLGKSCVLV